MNDIEKIKLKMNELRSLIGPNTPKGKTAPGVSKAFQELDAEWNDIQNELLHENQDK